MRYEPCTGRFSTIEGALRSVLYCRARDSTRNYPSADQLTIRLWRLWEKIRMQQLRSTFSSPGCSRNDLCPTPAMVKRPVRHHVLASGECTPLAVRPCVAGHRHDLHPAPPALPPPAGASMLVAGWTTGTYRPTEGDMPVSIRPSLLDTMPPSVRVVSAVNCTSSARAT